MNSTPLPRLYTEFASLWPLLSPPEDYAVEAEQLRGILHQHLGESSAEKKYEILELGAGGGHTLCHLADEYVVTAVDLSQPMLDCCKDLIPDVKIHAGDMRTIELGQTYDAILCHDAIDYILTPEDLKKVFRNVHSHLKPGGLFVVAPTYTRETFEDGDFAADQNGDENLELTYLTYIHDPEPNDDTFIMTLVYVIRQGGKVTVEQDEHTCGLFGEKQWYEWLNDAGFEVERMAEDGGDGDEGGEEEHQAQPSRLFVAVKS